MNSLKKLMTLYQKRKDPIRYARKIGVSVGEECRFVSCPIFGSEPWLITIGNHVEITSDVKFITHDGSTWVFRGQEPFTKVIRFGKIAIGDNSFIGTRSTIMPGVHIGRNCIVGAGSLVTKSIPDGEVWGGESRSLYNQNN